MLRRDVIDGQTRRTHYIGAVEVMWKGDNPATGTGVYRRTLGGVALVTYEEATDTSIERYQHTDHLGSLVALSTASGQVVARMNFDPWGKRQDPYHQAPDWQQWINPGTPAWAEAMLGITPLGFTGHEHVDALGIIHMNGRIYDPHLGRFLQADPFVEDATTLNRYTYVHNNPLLYTDPSGYLSVESIVRIALSVAITYFTGGIIQGTWIIEGGLQGAAAMGAAAAGGALAGYVATGSIEGALWGAFTGAVFAGIGQWSNTWGDWAKGNYYGHSARGIAARSVAHGLAGGTISEMQGGKFGHGFTSAGVTKLFSPTINNQLADNPGLQIFTAAALGGSLSAVTGGKFANGAVTAAMAYAFNQAQNPRDSETPIERRIGTAKNFVEITDEQALMIFGELGFGEQQISALSDMRPFDQATIDLAIDGLARAVLGDQMLNDLMKNVVDAASLPLKARTTRHILNEAALDDRFDPIRLQEAIDSRFHGVGMGGRIAGNEFIRMELNCKIQGC